MMEGFGVHTFRWINEAGESFFVKYHWKPVLGVHSVAWDEAQKISGKDPDFHRRDLWEAIESGAFAEYELGVQIVNEEDEFKFEFDLLDPTKLIPEEVVPVQIIGKLTLNRNPDNFFAETEQVAFHPGHLVPGIDFTNDPLLQGRLFSYTDTQLLRLGSANFHELPINKSVNQVHNNQRDGHMRQQINKSRTSYEPNTISGGCLFQAKAADGGFTSFAERIDSKKIRARSASFFDHFSQATLFYNSQSPVEQQHIIDALSFELGKLEIPAIRERVLGLLLHISKPLAVSVADALGIVLSEIPKEPLLNHSIPADGNPKDFQPTKMKQTLEKSEQLSMVNTAKDSIKTRVIAILAADGVDDAALNTVKAALEAQGAKAKVIAPKLGTIKGSSGAAIAVDQSFLTAASVLFDAVYVPGGSKSVEKLKAERDAVHFLNEAFRHCKAIGIDADVKPLLQQTYLADKTEGDKDLTAIGVVISTGKAKGFAENFIKAIAAHRYWDREADRKVPA
jgi:catalase